jgi:hypothetical protein
MIGWIKIHREINNHWIWENSDYLKWWLDILIEANYSEGDVLIKGTVLKCHRGQKLYSIETWSKRWKTNKSKANRFLKLLEKEKMIELKNETHTTRLTICKYDDYQDKNSDSETQTKRKRNANETQVKSIQERKEEEEEKEYNVYREFNHLSITNSDLEKLKVDYDIETIDSILDSIENHKNNKNYKSLYLTAKKWLQKEPKKKTLPDNVVVWKDGIKRVKTPF